MYPRIAAALPDSKFIFIGFAKSASVTSMFRERLRLEFRMEAHNLLNTANFALPDRMLGVESSGAISHTITAARQVQLAARLAW